MIDFFLHVVQVSADFFVFIEACILRALIATGDFLPFDAKMVSFLVSSIAFLIFVSMIGLLIEVGIATFSAVVAVKIIGLMIDNIGKWLIFISL